MRVIAFRWSGAVTTLLVGLGAVSLLGCQSTPMDLSEGPAKGRMTRPHDDAAPTYEDSLTGGEVFSMYCNQCHNARALGERSFASYQNVAAHMRVRANLTGKEYEKVLEFLRRWHDVDPPTPPVDTGPKRLIPSQPIAELREEMPGAAGAAGAGAGAAPAGGAAQPGGAAGAQPGAAGQPPAPARP
jgi:hypothetical protein